MRYYNDDECRNPAGRHRSWEYCYDFFGDFLAESNRYSVRNDLATLHLAFFLASWGMYRGSAFALKTTYKFHEGAIDILHRYKSLRSISLEVMVERSSEIKELCQDLKNHYLVACKQFYDGKSYSIPNFDLLVTKVILGTLCCIPAFDVYFCAGLKSFVAHLPASLDKRIDKLTIWISQSNVQDELLKCNTYFPNKQRYPDVKLIDMYFWQLGQEMERNGAIKIASKHP